MTAPELDLNHELIVMSSTFKLMKEGVVARAALRRIKQLEQIDSEAATHVESQIAMFERFTGEPPYVGWKGLGLALKEELKAKNERIKELKDKNAKLEARNAKLEKCHISTNEEVCQTLGKVLDYPWFVADKKNFPAATENDGVCVGNHIAETIAKEAADKIIALKAALNETADILNATGNPSLSSKLRAIAGGKNETRRNSKKIK